MPLKDLYQDISDRVMTDPDAAKVFFNMRAKPTAAWLKKIEPGVDAAQVIVNYELAQSVLDTLPDTPEPNTPEQTESKFNPNADDFDLEAEGETQAGLHPPEEKFPPAPKDEPIPMHADKISDLTELIDKLRPKVRLNGSDNLAAVLEAVLNGSWSRKAMMLTPLALPILPWVHFAHMAQLRSQPWLGYFQETDTLVQKARNLCAHHFLKSEAEWSWWVDGDIVPSWGDPAFFYDLKRLAIPQNRISPDFLRQKTLERLMKHGRKIVGAVYQQRRVKGAICSPADLRPQPSLDEKDAISSIRSRGPKDKLLEVDWCATGCLLVHRSVYDDIKRSRPDLAPENPEAPWNFFGHEVGRGGEDAAFCKLAKEAGHQSYLDLGCWVAHLGNFAYFPEPV